MADGGFATDQTPDDAGATMADDAATFARLAALPDHEYDRVRMMEAAKLRIRVQVLDKERKAAQRAARPPVESPEFSDDDLALRFTANFKHSLRFTAAWGRWHEWTGQYWREDKTLHAYTLVRSTVRAVAKTATPETGKKMASAATIAGVERLARADRNHAAIVEQWDADPMLLATPGGTVDLTTGELREADPDDHCTKITAVAPGGECPLWIRFIDRVTDGDKDLQQYLQRLSGYCLTGMINEQILCFFYGTGGNGKGLFLNTLAGILKDYASIAPIATFTESKVERHPTEIAALRGARMVIAQETEQGRGWNESRIKAFTGGEPITAHFMRQDDFTYVPNFKLLFAGNHKPTLKNVDEAIVRRFHLVPFTVTIPAGERDKNLPDKLKAEWPGILAWAIAGCLEWQRIGLFPPKAVVDATADYLAGEDAFSQWLADRCHVDAALWGQSTPLFKDWCAWRKEQGLDPVTQKDFRAELIKRFKVSNNARGNGFMGLALKPEIDEVEL